MGAIKRGELGPKAIRGDGAHPRAAKAVLISNVYISNRHLEVVDDLRHYSIDEALVLHFIYI